MEVPVPSDSTYTHFFQRAQEPTMTSTHVIAPDVSGDPTTADGTLLAYELIYAGGTRRVYADALDAFMDVLLPGYDTWDEQRRWEQRLHLAVRAQVVVQAEANTHDTFRLVPPDKQAVLQGTRHEPPSPVSWSQPIPLVLVASFYAPAGKIPRPVREQGMEPNLIWIDPSDETSLLESLHDTGYLTLNTSRA